MSVSYHAKLVLGVILEKSALFTGQRTDLLCPRGHVGLPGQLFCPGCGGKFSPVQKWASIKPFEDFCKAQAQRPGYTPEDMWNEEPYQENEMGFFKVAACRDYETESPVAYGVLLAVTPSEPSANAVSVFLEMLLEYQDLIVKDLDKMGLCVDKQSVCLHLTSKVSY